VKARRRAPKETFNGTVLNATAPQPHTSWTPYTYDLTPETFGVDPETFNGVMADVAHLTIVGDLVNGFDTTLLDDVGLYAAGSLGGLPPEQFSGFDSGNEGWRKGGRNTAATDWGFLAGAVAHNPTAGNPGGCVTITDEYDVAYWFSPESWAGDWRGYQTVSFDLKILTGTQFLAAGDMLQILSPHGVLTQSVPEPPKLGQWNCYEFQLTPEAFGVTQEVFDKVMRDVFMLGIRAEWIYLTEEEALDNVRLSKGSASYWAWLEQYLTAEQLADPALAGMSVDFDGDRSDNWSEFSFLTDPTDPADHFTPELKKQDDGSLLVRFPAKVGRVWRVERSDDLGLSKPWLRIGDEITGDNALKEIPVPIDGPRVFVRVGARE
jgi:hypothetical protein